ncbi:MAG: hypothetical protein K0S71_2705 [Clostridia bacterium]|jgi:membrane protease subunit HflC|nr:hypothetical protein [Clostridia bacterium]
MKLRTKITAGIMLAVTLIIVPNFFYTVEPDQVATVKRLGVIEKAIIKSESEDSVKASMKDNSTLKDVQFISRRGLFFKIPFIDQVRTYDAKYLTYISLLETINTSDRRKLDIQMYAQYRIKNPAIYQITVGTDSNRKQLMDSNVYPVVIQSANKLKFEEFFNSETMQTMMDERREQLNKTLEKEYGIEVIDIGIFRKNFPQSTIASIEEKMIKEIQKESEKLRAEGDAFYTTSTSETNRKQKEIIAKATEESAIIRAEAERQALEIYRASMSKDVEFYKFIQRMNAYRDIQDTTIFVDKENSFLKDLQGY